MAKLLLIAIVDDDPSFRRGTAGFVESLGYEVAAFGSAEEFLSSAKLSKTACLICDLHMPGMSGFELHDRLLREGYRLPVIFVTAYADPKVRGQAHALGALGLFDKPFPEGELILCLDRAIERRV
jgi:FixJ family two-component response regulator